MQSHLGSGYLWVTVVFAQMAPKVIKLSIMKMKNAVVYSVLLRAICSSMLGH